MAGVQGAMWGGRRFEFKGLRAFYDFSTRKTDYSFLYMLLYSVQISIMFFLSFFVFFSFLQICLTQLV